LAICLLVISGYSTVARAEAADANNSITVNADVRLVGSDGERSWLDGAFGKARFGGSDDGGFRLRPEATEASIAWRPRLSWSLAGTVVAIAQDGQHHAIDLSEAFLTFKPMARGPMRVSVRAGLFWPPVSLEHSGPNWAVTETITPSVINSWIGEEVKVAGTELTAAFPMGPGRVALSAALFGFNDTAGTLLAFRGWAAHDQKAVAFGKQPLPPFNAFISQVQPRYTRPVIELDNRIGYYGRMMWAPAAPVRIEALYYDNRGDPEAVNSSGQWGWRTRFTSLGALIEISPTLEVRMQAMRGRTEMGYPSDGRIWVDTRFRAFYLLVTRRIGESSVSGRVEAFGTDNHGSELVQDDDEHGLVATIAGRHPLNAHATMLIELEHIRSRRNARARLANDAREHQTVAQLALRIGL
jgi:hypothetical protein